MEELLTCAVCCERYCEVERQPVLLPRCGHSFCRPCVTLLLAGGCIICPTCRTDQRVESAHRLPTEYTLLAIIAAQESSKLDNCRRHDVKLSFWCMTCSQATCGECLFEDHPTHSHEVIRATTYVQNIKDSVHEVACKFMEALDMREQTYYKTVYRSARKIDDALRNVTVLRKDMGEARELMKGIKEEDTSISTATSLSEAAKYLGLKWNIQDANYTRTQNEEKEKDMTEKNNKDKKDETKEKKEKKKRVKSTVDNEEKKTLSKELEDIKCTESPAELLTSLPSPQTPSVTADSEQPKDVKRKSLIRKSKTLSVFEPFSMDKEITDIKKKIIELDNKEMERIEIENLKRIEEEEQEENDKKILEAKKEEAKKETEATLEAINAVVAETDDELRKTSEKDEDIARKEAEEEEARNQAAEEELERLNQILKKPRGRLARKFLAEKEKAEAESKKLELEANINQKNLVVSNNSADDSDTTSEESKEKTNGTPENLNKDDGSDDETKVLNANGFDPYEGELTLEEKTEKGEPEAEDSSKLLDFMKDPLFKVCVEGSEGRLAVLQWEPMGLHIYCHQFQQIDYDITIKANVLKALIPSKSPIVFMELSVGGGRPRRLYIRLWGHLRRAHNFLALCLGDTGSAFINTKLLQTYNLNEPGERVLGGDHEYNCGRGGCALLDDLEWNGDYAQPMQEGLVTAAGTGQTATNSLFLLCTRSDISRNFSCPFGEIIQGLDEVKDAIRKASMNEEEIWISDCGVVLEPPRA